MILRFATAASCLALLSACATATATIDEPVGTFPTDTFGDATEFNQAVMISPQAATQSLGRRFAAEVDTVVNFAFNSSALTPEAMATLQRQASWIQQFPEIRFSVYGHADKVGSSAYNERLGRARAQSVVSYLVSLGVDRRRLRALVSYGESRPVVNTQAPEVRNRRAVTEVSGFTAGSATKLNGKYAQVIFREYVASAVPQTTVTAAEAAGGE